MNRQIPRILIAGASARAAVQSALRAGRCQILSADLYQDQDLGPTAIGRLCQRYSNLPARASRVGVDGWMYVGALENHPNVVDAVPAKLLGNSGKILRHVRDPWRLRHALCQADLTFPKLARGIDTIDDDQLWLRKPIASAGGRRIRVIRDRLDEAASERDYFQQFIDGESQSGVFIGADRTCRLLGVTRQWIGSDQVNSDAFQYRGSFGPVTLSRALRHQWERIGRTLVEQFGLTGLFGVDAIVTGRAVTTVEVNPRFSASIEVLERTLGWNAWRLHFEACTCGRLPTAGRSTSSRRAAKRILFADQPCPLGDDDLIWLASQNRSDSWPCLADLPARPCLVPAGAPVLTVMAGPGSTEAAVMAELDCRVQLVRSRLRGSVS